jgi:hypothetical protein
VKFEDEGVLAEVEKKAAALRIEGERADTTPREEVVQLKGKRSSKKGIPANRHP